MKSEYQEDSEDMKTETCDRKLESQDQFTGHSVNAKTSARPGLAQTGLEAEKMHGQGGFSGESPENLSVDTTLFAPEHPSVQLLQY